MEEWKQALVSLIENPRQRNQMGEAARRSVLQHYSPAVRARDLAKLLPQLLS
jgi:glycosyltransferase involved in cell wall biosynthesis